MLPPRPRSHLVLAAVSLANLLMLRCWAWVLDPATQYFLHEPRPWRAYAGTILLFGLVAVPAVSASLLAAARSSGRTWRMLELGFFCTLMVALYASREQIADVAGRPARSYVEEIDMVEKAIGLLSVLFLPCAFIRPARRVVVRRLLITGLLVLSPFALVTTAQCATLGWKAWSSRSGIEPRAPSAHSLDHAPHRVVVLVLDEWDQFLTFEDRDPAIALPEIDALATGSVHLTRAIAPGTVTETVLPSLLTGRPVVDTADAGHSDRILIYEDGTRERFSDAETFVSIAKRRGFDAGLVGWYHPYCRVLGDDFVSCRSRALRQELDGRSMLGVVKWQAMRWLEGAPQGRKLLRWARFTRPLRTTSSWHEESWREIHEATLRLAVDPGIDLLVAHYPLPHLPALRRGSGYDGNLVRVDESLGELVRRLDSSAFGRRTSLIVLSDHPRRGPGLVPLRSDRLAAGEPRPVPMFVRIDGGGPAVVIDRPVTTLVLHDLVLGILEGVIRENDDIERVLDLDTADAGTRDKSVQ